MRENNKLIAEFMGYETYIFRGYTMFVFEENNHRTHLDLHYHKSWDWLMPVVEKIETTNNGCTLVIIEDERCHIDNQNGIEIDSVGHTKIEATYNAVIEFIKQFKP